MVEPGSPASSVHLPWFIAGPGQTDVLLVIMGVFLVLFTFLIGVLMLRLHHLPAHRWERAEDTISIRCIAMFTHENVLWIAALLLALVDLPDFTGLFDRIAQSVARIAWRKRPKTPSAL